MSRTYESWHKMMARCYNPKEIGYGRYGGRGITVCTRWKIFANFLQDMGKRPLNKTLDRFPNRDGNYELGNCRWATYREQNSNLSSNHRIFAHGLHLTLADWARRLGCDHSTIRSRLMRGWNPERAVTAEVQIQYRNLNRGRRS